MDLNSSTDNDFEYEKIIAKQQHKAKILRRKVRKQRSNKKNVKLKNSFI